MKPTMTITDVPPPIFDYNYYVIGQIPPDRGDFYSDELTVFAHLEWRTILMKAVATLKNYSF